MFNCSERSGEIEWRRRLREADPEAFARLGEAEARYRAVQRAYAKGRCSAVEANRLLRELDDLFAAMVFSTRSTHTVAPVMTPRVRVPRVRRRERRPGVRRQRSSSSSRSSSQDPGDSEPASRRTLVVDRRGAFA